MSKPLPTLALENYIRLHGNMAPEEITELGKPPPLTTQIPEMNR